MSIRNYHTHTQRCRHAQDTDEQYVLAAIAAGYQTLGFADHGPFPFPDGYVSPLRMTLPELAGYTSSLTGLQAKYADQIEICIGLEYEYFPAYLPFLHEIKKSTPVSYFILGNHFDTDEQGGFFFSESRTPAQIERYAACTIAGMETGLYSYLAHPDLFLHSYPAFDAAARQVSRALCQAARQSNMPLEYNVLGLEKQAQGVPGIGYPCREFWQIAAEEGCKAIVGMDAHRAQALAAAPFASACRTLASLGLCRVERLDVGEVTG